MKTIKRLAYVILIIIWLLITAIVAIATTIAWVINIPNYIKGLAITLEIGEKINNLIED